MRSLMAGLALLAVPLGFAQDAPGATDGSVRDRMSDRERAGLRGPVKTVTEYYDWPGGTPDQQMSTTTEYDVAGRVVSVTTGSASSQQVTRHVYSPQGKLLKTVTSKASQVVQETKYAYGPSGRMTSQKSQGEHQNTAVAYEYDGKGRRSSLEPAEPKRSDVAYGVHNDGSDGSFLVKAKAICGAIEACAKIKTTYNERDVPEEFELLEAGGRLITRWVRDFDQNGNVVGERVAEESVDLMLPTQIRREVEDDKISPEQAAAFGKIFGAMFKSSSRFEYDQDNRLRRSVVSNGVEGEEVTTITYNEKGDRATERVERSGGSGFSGTVTPQGTILPDATQTPIPGSQQDTRYSYVYDGHGNWTERVTELRSKAEDEFRRSGTLRRTLTYYGAN